MKTTFFLLNKPKKLPVNYGDTFPAEYHVPMLPAYAIEYSVLKTPPASAIDLDRDPTHEQYEGKGYVIKDKVLIWKNYRKGFMGEIVPILFIYYHGIRDHALLFPNLKNPSLAERLGKFYDEAEKSFDSGAWLSFSLMCGAIFEGLLNDRIKSDNFYDSINRAKQQELISEEDAKIMHSVRDQRNLVHASRYQDGFISRAMAMDIRRTLDEMIKKFSYFDL